MICVSDSHWQNPPSRSAIMAGFLFPENTNTLKIFFTQIFGLTIKQQTCIIRGMKTYMSDGRIPRKDGTWYTPYQQDMDDLAYRKANKMSSTAKIVWILIWFGLLAVFW